MEHSNNNIVTGINENQANAKVSLTYPYIMVHGAGDSLTVTLRAIAPGPLPVLITYKGTTYNIGSISKSALELAKLLKVFKFSIHLSQTDVREINETRDILEVGVW